MPSSCSVYEAYLNLCKTCQNGYFLSTDKKVCTANPVGIIGCRTYTNISTCTACDANKYLNNNLCPDVKEADKTENCMYYSDATTCEKCNESFFLAPYSGTDNKRKNECKAMTAANCKTTEAFNKCTDCLNGYVLDV